MIEIKTWQRNFTLKLGNLVLVDKAFPILTEYTDRLLDEYHASVAEEDFARDSFEITKKVNKWVSSKTNNRMNRLFDRPFDYRTQLLLINVIYFEGNWKIPFERHATYARTFNNYDGTRGDVQMMFTVGSYRYGEFWDLNLKILELAFQGDISMFIILPNDPKGLTETLTTLTNQRLENMIQLMGRQTVEVQFPKFRLEGRYDLNKILYNMGLFLPFTTNTDFFQISPKESLKVTDSMHTALIQIGEEGSESAFSASLKFPNLARSKGPRFIVDTPFGFVIRDSTNGINLFLGAINKL